MAALLGFALSLTSVVLAAPPNISLDTVPIGYIGGAWPVKTDAQIDMLSKLRVVITMQRDGECWQKCCPNMTRGGECNTPLGFNSSTLPGCNPTCNQHGTQTEVHARIKADALAKGRPVPHFMLYANSVYNWPFDAELASGVENVAVLDIHGVPHAEKCDPGIYPSYFFDFGREAGREAFLSTFRKYIANTSTATDGVMLDCFNEDPLNCNKNGTCIAQRNHWIPGNKQFESIVTKSQVDAYSSGKEKTLKQATAIVAAGAGGMFTAKLWQTQKSHDPYGANTAYFTQGMSHFQKDPQNLIAHFDAIYDVSGYKYLIWRAAVDASPGRAPDDLESKCDAFTLGSFLLALRPGCYLLCQGWSDDFNKALGSPNGPAVMEGNILSRTFASGTSVSWKKGSEIVDIKWASDVIFA